MSKKTKKKQYHYDYFDRLGVFIKMQKDDSLHLMDLLDDNYKKCLVMTEDKQIWAFMFNPNLSDEIDSIRNKMDWPSEGFHFQNATVSPFSDVIEFLNGEVELATSAKNKNLGETIKLLKYDPFSSIKEAEKLRNVIQTVVDKHNLAQKWLIPIANLAMFNDLYYYPFEVDIGVDLRDEQKGLPPLNLSIGSLVTKESLLKWIDDNWDRVETYQKSVYKQVGKQSGSQNETEMMIGLEIYRLWENGLSKDEIAEHFANDEKYGDRSGLLNPRSIKTRYESMKKYLKNARLK